MQRVLTSVRVGGVEKGLTAASEDLPPGRADRHVGNSLASNGILERHNPGDHIDFSAVKVGGDVGEIPAVEVRTRSDRPGRRSLGEHPARLVLEIEHERVDRCSFRERDEIVPLSRADQRACDVNGAHDRRAEDHMNAVAGIGPLKRTARESRVADRERSGVSVTDAGPTPHVGDSRATADLDRGVSKRDTSAVANVHVE